MIVVMHNGNWYPIPEDRDAPVTAAYRAKRQKIDLYGDETVVVKESAIAELMSNEQYELLEHRKRGDWRCAEGVWHEKVERFCPGHKKAEEVPSLDYLRQGKDKSGKLSSTGKRWLKLIGLNNEHLKHHGTYGTLRTLAELDQFEVDGVWPSKPDRKGSYNTRKVARAKPQGPFPASKTEYEIVDVPND